MKKQIVYILVVFVLILSACSNGEADIKLDKSDEKLSEVEIVDKSTVEEPEVIEEVTEPLYEVNPTTYAIEPIGSANAKVVLLTIDDAPDKWALDMAKTLKGLDAPAIFFVNGHFIDTEEEKVVLKKIHELGFMIGNHTETHANLKQLSEEEQKEEILTVSDAVEETIGERPIFFRAPFGSNTDYSKALALEDGMLLMNWSFGYDWEKKYMDVDALADIMVNTEFLRDGANLLMHDREWTAGALEKIVLGLREKGYDFVDPATIRVSEE